MPLATENAKQKYILKSALHLFFRRGFNSVTTDDIAWSLGMSKKTLYQYFSSKKDIALRAIEANISGLETRVDRLIYSPEKGFPEKLTGVLVLIQHQISLISEEFLEDLMRRLPEGRKIIDNFRTKIIKNKMRDLLEEGQYSGYVRTDLELDSLSFILIGFIIQGASPERLVRSGLSLRHLFTTVFSVIMNGILTTSGTEQFSRAEESTLQKEFLYEDELFIE